MHRSKDVSFKKLSHGPKLWVSIGYTTVIRLISIVDAVLADLECKASRDLIRRFNSLAKISIEDIASGSHRTHRSKTLQLNSAQGRKLVLQRPASRSRLACSLRNSWFRVCGAAIA